MIIQRMADALRLRDWFGVVLEILIVVIGIFVGLQVNDWNGRRQERILEQVYLERLWTEMSDNKVELVDNLERYTKRVDALRNAIKYVLRDESEPELLAKVKEQGTPSGVLPTVPLQFSAYQDLVSTGNLGLIRNTRLREALQRSVIEKQYYDEQLEYFRHGALSTRGAEFELIDDLKFFLDKDDNVVIDFEIERYRGDQRYVQLLYLGFERQIKLRWNLKRTEKATDATLAILACELKKPECEQDQPS